MCIFPKLSYFYHTVIKIYANTEEMLSDFPTLLRSQSKLTLVKDKYLQLLQMLSV